MTYHILNRVVRYLPLLVVGAGIVFLGSCKKTDILEENSSQHKDLSTMKVDPNFSWETARQVEFVLSGSASGVVMINTSDGVLCYHKAFLSAGIPYVAKCALPSYEKEVQLKFNGHFIKIPVTGTRITYQFN